MPGPRAEGQTKAANKDKFGYAVAIALCLGGIALGFVATTFYASAIHAAKEGDLQGAEFFISIGFAFAFGGFAAVFTGLSEMMAERRHERLVKYLRASKEVNDGQ